MKHTFNQIAIKLRKFKNEKPVSTYRWNTNLINPLVLAFKTIDRFMKYIHLFIIWLKVKSFIE